MVVTIHDLTHIVYSEFLSNKFAKIYAKIMMKIALKKAKLVLTESENTKKDILKYFKVDENKIKVIYLGVKEGLEEKQFDLQKIHVINDVLEAFPLVEKLKQKETYVLLENDLPDIFNEQ